MARFVASSFSTVHRSHAQGNPGDLTTASPLLKQTWQGWSRLDFSRGVPTIPEPKPPRRLHPLPRGLVELYGLIAVLVVLIPEWIADGTLSLGDTKRLLLGRGERVLASSRCGVNGRGLRRWSDAVAQL